MTGTNDSKGVAKFGKPVRGDGKRTPSSIDVARRAGVSQSAVSRAFSGNASVSPEMREKVLAVAKEMGYRPNFLPRILVTQRSQLIAIVIGGLYNPYYASMFEAFTRRMQQRGYLTVVFVVDHHEYFDKAIPQLMRYRVDAVISALAIMSDEAAAVCAEMAVPIVLLNGRQSNRWVSSVCSDNVAGAAEIANLFVSRGAKRFAYVAGTDTLANEHRQAGYLVRLRELGIDDVRIVAGDYHFDGGRTAGRELFGSGPRPDAVFCANDLTAAGVIDVARSEFGLNIPKDLMIAGFDDAAFAAWPAYDLTTVRQETERLVDVALEVLQEQWDAGSDAHGALRIVPGTLVERGSTTR